MRIVLKASGSRRLLSWVMATAVAMLTLPAIAIAHLERPSYWPDPSPDTGVSPAAGGAVPEARSLASAVTGAGPGDVLVVCKGTNGAQSLAALDESLTSATKKGYTLRPSQGSEKVSKSEATELREINAALAQQ